MQSPNKVRDILASASIAKIISDEAVVKAAIRNEDKEKEGDQIKENLLSLWCGEVDSKFGIRDRLVRLWPLVQKKDSAVTKSIEAAEIVNFFQSSKNYPEE